jgi:hypothetical protein
MTKAIYPKALEALLKANLDLDGSVKIALVDTSTGGAAYNSAHEFVSSIAAGIVGRTSALSGKSFTNGVFFSDDGSALGVSGVEFEAIVFFLDTGDDATSRLIAFEDEDISGAPATPDGGNFTVECPTAGWFTL